MEIRIPDYNYEMRNLRYQVSIRDKIIEGLRKVIKNVEENKHGAKEDMLIIHLGLTNRTENCLLSQGIDFVKDLYSYNKHTLLKLRQLGRTTFENLMYCLRQNGFYVLEKKLRDKK